MCEYAGCENPPTHTVRFRDPKEYLCYCKAHAIEGKNMAHGKAVLRLT